LALVAHQKVMLVLLKAMPVQTLYLAQLLLMVVAVEAGGVALAEQVATVVQEVVAVLVLALGEQQLLGRVIMEELHLGQYPPRRTMDALEVAVRGQ
jgi:hypothetical protein